MCDTKSKLICTARLETQRQIADELEVPYSELDRIIELLPNKELGDFNAEKYWAATREEKKDILLNFINPDYGTETPRESSSI